MSILSRQMSVIQHTIFITFPFVALAMVRQLPDNFLKLIVDVQNAFELCLSHDTITRR